eukprot:GABV01000552.1.p1 GENE.GABV01000552.1~~GABV01000552.1.p1  ORF type:complete len:227 (+),score=42.53 GABV01000552.1:278-958(+)
MAELIDLTGDDASVWSCKACTFDNQRQPFVYTCMVCGNEDEAERARVVAVQFDSAPPAAPPVPPPGAWNCSACTSINLDLKGWRCSICDTVDAPRRARIQAEEAERRRAQAAEAERKSEKKKLAKNGSKMNVKQEKRLVNSLFASLLSSSSLFQPLTHLPRPTSSFHCFNSIKKLIHRPNSLSPLPLRHQWTILLTHLRPSSKTRCHTAKSVFHRLKIQTMMQLDF